MLDKIIEEQFLGILQEELIPAMGCTEPIALAYAAAKAKEIIVEEPIKIIAKCSGNIIKNVRCVAIPNSNGRTGIEVAVALGAFGGQADLKMEVLDAVTQESIEKVDRFIQENKCEVCYLDSDIPLHFIIELYSKHDWVSVEVQVSHLNIVEMKKNDTVIYTIKQELDDSHEITDRSKLSIETIKQFADQIELSKIKYLYDQVMQYNMNIAYEGMSGEYGLGLGRIIRESYAEGVITRIKAFTAAASEARMDGCDMPVMINSGSGNQGIASTVPLIVYARERNIPQEKLYRSLVFSSLLTILQKEYIGKLSAFCGAVSASCAAGAAITYMENGTIKQIKDTIDNTLANIPGIICDGAKISCAAKIASSLDATMMAHYLAMKGKAYESFTGILKEEAGETISCVGRIGKVGMHQTDKEIIKLILE